MNRHQHPPVRSKLTPRAGMPDYDAIYRQLHRSPFKFPPPYGRRPELSDLWERDQEEFRRVVDAVENIGRDH